jgi:hypothetical protein
MIVAARAIAAPLVPDEPEQIRAEPPCAFRQLPELCPDLLFTAYVFHVLPNAARQASLHATGSTLDAMTNG